MPALEPMRLTSTYFDNLIRDGESKEMEKQWNGAGGDRALIATYDNPPSAWLFAQAAVQLLVAVGGLGNHIRKQRRISVMATAAVCFHIFLDALLTIGCLIILFSVMPAQDRVTTVYMDALALIDSVLSGPAGTKMFDLADIVIFENWSEKVQKAETFFLNEIFPLISRQALQALANWLDFAGELHSPDLVLEQILFVKVIIGVVIFYGAIRCIMNVGIHMFVTSPLCSWTKSAQSPCPSCSLLPSRQSHY
ncbi:unnamed protein product [Prorocentrum cordatum]|uniref:Uncharacterized protein n=1 Tax=Prorocentrum cordatum TaxID=2364126 RepID=A0ABN9RA03_9DINO|nr:unnamed protein product [Polarella glacialis]